jgi:hypothetical protein
MTFIAYRPTQKIPYTNGISRVSYYILRISFKNRISKPTLTTFIDLMYIYILQTKTIHKIDIYIYKYKADNNKNKNKKAANTLYFMLKLKLK